MHILILMDSPPRIYDFSHIVGLSLEGEGGIVAEGEARGFACYRTNLGKNRPVLWMSSA